jgi:hypothetical protein
VPACPAPTHTSAYAYVRIRQHTYASAYVSIRQHTSACVSIRIRQNTAECQHTPAYQLAPPLRMRQHASTYVSIRIRQNTAAYACVSIRQHTSSFRACMHLLLRLPPAPVLRSIRSSQVDLFQHTSAYVSIRQHTSAYLCACFRLQRGELVSICQHTSAYVSIRQHTSAYVSIPERRARHRFSRAPSNPHTRAAGVRELFHSLRLAPECRASAALYPRSQAPVREQHCSPTIRQHTSAYVSIRQHTSEHKLSCGNRTVAI